jgi:hypothetical protein
VLTLDLKTPGLNGRVGGCETLTLSGRDGYGGLGCEFYNIAVGDWLRPSPQGESKENGAALHFKNTPDTSI